METNKPDIQKNSTIKAIVLCCIGVFLSFKSIDSGIVKNEATFVSLVCISVVMSFVVYFENRITSFGFGAFKATINAQVAKTTEPSVLSISGSLPELRGNFIFTDDASGLVIKAIGGTEYTWRYLENIVKDSGLSFDVARDKLNWLIVNEFAAEFDGVDGKVYALSSKGQSEFHKLTT